MFIHLKPRMQQESSVRLTFLRQEMGNLYLVLPFIGDHAIIKKCHLPDNLRGHLEAWRRFTEMFSVITSITFTICLPFS
jgi:hypothetical protein